MLQLRLMQSAGGIITLVGTCGAAASDFYSLFIPFSRFAFMKKQKPKKAQSTPKGRLLDLSELRTEVCTGRG